MCFVFQMALQERLDKFKKQQEKCQTTLSSIAASKAAASQKSAAHGSSNGRNAPPAVKFSNDTERLQHINSIRKAPVGAQMKRVIDLLLEVPILINSNYIGLCFIGFVVLFSFFFMVLVIDSHRHDRKIKIRVLLGTCVFWVVGMLSPVWINMSTDTWRCLD